MLPAMPKGMRHAIAELDRAMAETNGTLARWDALEEAVRQMMVTARPPRWRIWRNYNLARNQRYALACIHHMYPWWFAEVLKCGVDLEELLAVATLLGHKPRIHPRFF